MEELPLVSSSGVLFCDCIYFRIPKQRMVLDASCLLTHFLIFYLVESEYSGRSLVIYLPDCFIP